MLRHTMVSPGPYYPKYPIVLLVRERIFDRIETVAPSSLDSLAERAMQNRTRGTRAREYITGP